MSKIVWRRKTFLNDANVAIISKHVTILLLHVRCKFNGSGNLMNYILLNDLIDLLWDILLWFGILHFIEIGIQLPVWIK